MRLTKCNTKSLKPIIQGNMTKREYTKRAAQLAGAVYDFNNKNRNRKARFESYFNSDVLYVNFYDVDDDMMAIKCDRMLSDKHDAEYINQLLGIKKAAIQVAE